MHPEACSFPPFITDSRFNASMLAWLAPPPERERPPERTLEDEPRLFRCIAVNGVGVVRGRPDEAPHPSVCGPSHNDVVTATLERGDDGRTYLRVPHWKGLSPAYIRLSADAAGAQPLFDEIDAQIYRQAQQARPAEPRRPREGLNSWEGGTGWTPDRRAFFRFAVGVMFSVALPVFGGILFGVSNDVYQIEEAAEREWAAGTCTVVGLDVTSHKCGHAQTLIHVLLNSGDRKIPGGEPISNFRGVALKYASWDAKCGGNCFAAYFAGRAFLADKYCFAEKSDAKRYEKKFSVGEDVGCYFDPDAWGDIAMEFRDVGGIWIAGVVMLSLASMSFCMCTREYYVADQDARKGYVALFPKFIALGCMWLVFVVFR